MTPKGPPRPYSPHSRQAPAAWVSGSPQRLAAPAVGCPPPPPTCPPKEHKTDGRRSGVSHLVNHPAENGHRRHMARVTMPPRSRRRCAAWRWRAVAVRIDLSRIRPDDRGMMRWARPQRRIHPTDMKRTDNPEQGAGPPEIVQAPGFETEASKEGTEPPEMNRSRNGSREGDGVCGVWCVVCGVWCVVGGEEGDITEEAHIPREKDAP